MPDDRQSPKPTRRRWLQFSLRTLMLLCLVAAIPLGYVAWRRHLGQRQAEIATELEAAGFALHGYKLPVTRLAGYDRSDFPPIRFKVSDAESGEVSYWNQVANKWDQVEFTRDPFAAECYFFPPPPDATPTNDHLWCFGYGETIFGEALFRRVTWVKGASNTVDADRIWSEIGHLSELTRLDLSAEQRRFFESEQMMPALNRLTKLETLKIPGDIPPEFLERFRTPKSLRSLVIGQSRLAASRWREHYATGETIDPQIIGPERTPE